MRLSTGLVNKLTDTYSLKDSLAGFVLDVYSGTQPTLPDNVPNGVLLVTVTNASGAYTAETAATGTVTLAGASGSVNTVTVNGVDILGGAVSFITDLNTTATAVATQINRNPKNHQFIASTTGSSAVVTLTAANGMGTLPNTWVVTATFTTMTATYADMASGVNAANGLNFDLAVAGVISKLASETWSGNAVSGGTAGWFRIRGAGDAGTASSTAFRRIDGSIGTSGADMNLGSLTVTNGAPFIVPTATLTLPQQ